VFAKDIVPTDHRSVTDHVEVSTKQICEVIVGKNQMVRKGVDLPQRMRYLGAMQTTESNQVKFEQLMARLHKDPAALDAFSKNPTSLLSEFGIPAVSAFDDLDEKDKAASSGAHRPAVAQAAAVGGGENLSVEWVWWGVKVILNEKLTQDVMTGMDWIKGLGPIVDPGLVWACVLTAVCAAIAGQAIALLISAKSAEVKLVDNGNGVYFPLLWPQIPVLIGLGAFPPMEAVADAVTVHPFRN
jgi:hypothetical protein